MKRVALEKLKDLVSNYNGVTGKLLQVRKEKVAVYITEFDAETHKKIKVYKYANNAEAYNSIMASLEAFQAEQAKQAEAEALAQAEAEQVAEQEQAETQALQQDIDNLDYNDCIRFKDWDINRGCEIIKIGVVVDLRNEKDGVWIEYDEDWFFIERERIVDVIKEDYVIKEYDWIIENESAYDAFVGDFTRARNELEDCIRVIEESKRKK